MDIKFSEDEITLLNKGLTYNLHNKHKHWITNLALEAETAINLLPPTDQEHIQYQVTKNIQHLYTYQKYQRPQNIHDQKEWKIIQQIKKKLEEHNAIITKADKGNTIVIIQKEDFIQNNKFTILDENYTHKYQKDI